MTITFGISYWIFRLLAKLYLTRRTLHPERIPPTGPVILAANHTSFLDPPLVGTSTLRGCYFLARKTLLDIPVIGPILPKLNVIPVDLDKGGSSALRVLIRQLRDQHAIVVFPEGTRSPDGRPQTPEPGIGFVIARTLAPVVPIHISGAYEALPRGATRITYHPVTVTIGHPIQFTEADCAEQPGDKDKSAIYQRLSNRVMQAIAALENEG